MIVSVIRFFAAALVLVFSITASHAHEVKAGNLLIDHPIIPATVKSAPVAAGYLKITNNGDAADRLVSVSADFAGKNSIHTM